MQKQEEDDAMEVDDSPSTSADQTDEVVAEYDVVLSKDIDSRLYVLQYPLRSTCMPFPKETVINSRFKTRMETLELKIGLDTESGSYSKQKGEQIASAVKSDESTKSNFMNLMDYQMLTGTSSLGESADCYVAGFVKKGVFHMAPITGLFQMRPDLSYLAGDDKKHRKEPDDLPDRVESATDSETDTMAKTIRVKFARKETDESKKQRESSSQHRRMIADSDQWIPLKFVRPNQAESLQTSSILVESHSTSSNNVTFISNVEQILQTCITRSTESAMKELHVSSDLIPMKQLKQLSLASQVGALLAKAGLLTFSNLLSHLAPSVDRAIIIATLPKYACLVRGCWVLRSEILYPKGTVSPKSGAASELLCRMRDYVVGICTVRLLYRLHKGEKLTRKEVCNVWRMCKEDVDDVLFNVGRLCTPERYWRFRLDDDDQFVISHPEVFAQQERVWECKWSDLRQSLLTCQKTVSGRRPSRQSFRLRRTSARMLVNDEPSDVINGDVETRDWTLQLRQFVYEQLTDRRLVGLSELKRLLQLRMSEAAKDHVLAGMQVSDSDIAEQVALVGAVSLVSETNGQPVYAYGETGNWPEARKMAIQLLQQKDRFRFATFRTQCSKRMAELPDDQVLKTVLSDYCAYKSGVYSLKVVPS